MNTKAKLIIKQILLSATISFIWHSKAEARQYDDFLEDDDPSDISNKKRKSRCGFTNPLLKLTKIGRVHLIQSHFSHSSHSSHSSHASHSSHYSAFGTEGKGSSSSQNYSSRDAYSVGIGDVTGDKNQYAPKITSKEAGRLKLGDRILKLGLYGNDVKELSDYLISKNLLSPDQLEKQGRFVKYSTSVEEAVKELQKSLNLQENGQVDKNLAEKINKEIEKDKIK